MKSRRILGDSTPYQVETALKKLGANLKIARVRRGLTIEEVAQKIGMSRYTVADAEKGKPQTGAGVYAALLWVYGFVDQLGALLAPDKDEEGLTLELHRLPARARHRRGLSNEF